MTKPYCDIDRIKKRQLGVSMVAFAQNIDFISDCTKLLRHVHDIRRLLLRIKKVESNAGDWSRLYVSLENGLKVVQLVNSFLVQAERLVREGYVHCIKMSTLFLLIPFIGGIWTN